MAYFMNSLEFDYYEEQYCDNCIHNLIDHGCPCFAAHELWNYDACNTDDSILHKMIPRDKKGHNLKCIFYQERIA